MGDNPTLDEAIAALQKKYGKDVVMQNDEKQAIEVEAISTGCFSLDEAFGCGGVPRGRIIEIHGEESSGKSTMAMFLMSQVQKNGGKAALIDAEFAFDAAYATAIGVDVNHLFVSQPTTLEEGMDVIKALVETNDMDVIVIDSVAALVPKKEVEGDEMLKDSVADQARLMNKALRILTGPISRSKTVVIFINQIREKIGVFFGKKETTPGGRALKFYASVRMNVSKGERIIGKNDEQIGNWIKATMVKNKVGYPWRSATFELFYEKGIDLIGDLVDSGERLGVVTKTGNTYSYKEIKLGAGRDKSKQFLEENSEVAASIRAEIIRKIKQDEKDKDASKEAGSTGGKVRKGKDVAKEGKEG